MWKLYSIFWQNSRMILNYAAHICNLKSKKRCCWNQQHRSHIRYLTDDNPPHFSNTPGYPHGAADSHNPPERYTPANPVRWLRTYSEQPHIRHGCSQWRLSYRRHIWPLHKRCQYWTRKRFVFPCCPPKNKNNPNPSPTEIRFGLFFFGTPKGTR